MYIVMVMRTVDGAASFYGPFTTKLDAEQWFTKNASRDVRDVTHAVYPLLSSNRDRRRGQQAKLREIAQAQMHTGETRNGQQTR